MVAMDAMPARDRLDEEIEAVLAAKPELGARLERQAAEHKAGTLKTIPDDVVRARMDKLEKARRQANRLSS